MTSTRPVLIFDDKVSQAQREAEGQREQFEIGNIANFSGDKSSDVVYLCGDSNRFLNDEKNIDFILDKVTKTCGKLSLKCIDATDDVVPKLAKHLRYAGFIKVETPSTQLITAEKDKLEVGEVKPLSFASKIKTSNEPVSVQNGWKISNDFDINNINKDDLIDEDSLLTEEDYKKPDPASLRVCGTTNKRKACKDCSCGLAEELAGDAKSAAPPNKSSCGSCYLGDAFRCASCPYMGTPPFKPGEKVQLTNDSDL